jgi:hypothetical protein
MARFVMSSAGTAGPAAAPAAGLAVRTARGAMIV